MPSVETFDCVDYAVMWPAEGINSFAAVKIGNPVELRVRWNDTETDGQDPQGNKFTVSVKLAAKQHIPYLSILWHGRLADLPDSPTGLQQVISNDSGVDVNGRAMRYEFGLAKYMDALPESALGTGS